MVRCESRSSTIGHITLDTKQTGAPSAGNPHAGCDVAGAGNGFTVRLLRHSQRKRGATARLDLRNTAPVLDPTGLLDVWLVDGILCAGRRGCIWLRGLFFQRLFQEWLGGFERHWAGVKTLFLLRGLFGMTESHALTQSICVSSVPCSQFPRSLLCRFFPKLPHTVHRGKSTHRGAVLTMPGIRKFAKIQTQHRKTGPRQKPHCISVFQ
jgi:hypothetical protein